MKAFADRLIAVKAEVIFLDPLYLCLGQVDPKNVFEMGAALRTVGEMLLGAGSTPVVVHHANGLLATGEVMELQHMSYCGLERCHHAQFHVAEPTDPVPR